MHDPRYALIRLAAAGDKPAMRQLVTDLTPVIRCSVALALARSSGRREAKQEIEDVTQTVLLALFSDRAQALLQWDPARGLDLDSFVSLLAKNETASILRSRRRNPWTEDPTLHEDLDRNIATRMGPESETISRDMVVSLETKLRERLTERGFEMFTMMFVKGLPIEEICASSNMTLEAAYTWKSRLGKQVKEIIAELAAVPPDAPEPAVDSSGPRSDFKNGPCSGFKSGPLPVVQRRGSKAAG